MIARALAVFIIFFSVTHCVFGQTPSANFTASPLTGCSPLIVTFQDLSTGNPVTWSWDFGNGNTSALQHPSTTYFTPGNYTVKLTVTNAAGNAHTLTRQQFISVYDVPNVNFSASSQNGCFPFHVQFTDLSTAGSGNTNVSWQWDFGNGVTSTQRNPLITYSTAGNYPVTLRVTNDKGCTKIISRPNYITVTPGVTSGFTHTQPSVCSAPAGINFTNISTGPGTLTYQWRFGDGNTSALQSPVHTYTGNGTFTVSLITASSGGCVDTVRKTVTIGGFTTSFNSPASACLDKPVSFTNTSSPAPASSRWDFGDGATSTQVNPSHTYAATGPYTVKLYNTYSTCVDSITRTITVTPLPVANFTSPSRVRCGPPFTVNFQDISTGGAVAWQWDFGDGNTAAVQNPSHTYTNYGFYTVRLIITNGNGCTDTLVIPDYIRIRRPIISIPGLPYKGCIPYTKSFTPGINSLEPITSYLWEFGDGNTATIPNPVHSYPVQGTYTVKLFVTTSNGCLDSAVSTIKVGTKPVTDFSATPIPVCAFRPVQFTDLSSTTDEWQWQFGDGTRSILQNPDHTYADTGRFTVQLISTNSGCADTLIKTNYIRVLPPIAKFDVAPNCNNRLQFAFTDQSIGPVSWLWNFGDGNTSAAQNPVHSFPALGSYNVTLTVTNGGCSHSVTKAVRPTRQSPDFSTTADTVCRGTAITLTPTNINPALTTSLLWRMGNGVQITGGTEPVTYTYPASGTYTVTLVATDINGCKDSIVKTNYIRVNGPIANFNATNARGCMGITVTFNDLSATDGVNPLTSWQWNFGDASSQTFTAPPFQHTYNGKGTYSVSLRVTDASGCSHSVTKSNVVITTDPVPNFISPDTLSCPAATVQFTNTSTPAGFTSSWDFGDGNTSATTSPSHSYATAGRYSVKLVITDNYGCRDSITKTSFIRVDTPAASFTVNDSISSCTPFEVKFTNTSTYYDSVFWDFGPGEGTSTINNPVHYYSLPGTYRVKLIAISPGDCEDSAFITITVNDTAGSNISYNPLGGCNPLSVDLNTFTSGTISSYFWDFGDGTTQSTTTPVINHSYNSFGNFVPKVIMMDPSGCLIPLTGADTIRVVGSNPNFGFSDSLLCDSGFVQFSDSTTSSEPIATWQWNFGDGGTSVLQNPVHHYTSPGIYDVTLSIETVNGCQNTITIPAAVKVVLRPLIDITGITKICLNDSILHTGIFLRSDTSVVTWAWTFPNGHISTLQNPPYQAYSTAGNFDVTAIATNSSGCKDTAIESISVSPLPTVDMPGQMTVQAGFPATIPATYSAGVNTWTWTPATGLSCTNCPAPDADPNFNTTYYVEFSDANGCRGEDSIHIVVICKEGNLFVPNTFSPNGDGSNDRFYPRGRGLYTIKFLRIFNRWGEMVFEKRSFQANDATQGWDGRYKGQQAQPDVYVYQIEVVCDNGDIIKLTGNISLIL